MTPGISDQEPDEPSRPEGNPDANGASDPQPSQLRLPFPWSRLFYAIGFSFVAWVVFWVIVILLAPLHYITVAITGRANEELQLMNLRAARYLFELLGFIAGAHDERPFPLGPFPKD